MEVAQNSSRIETLLTYFCYFVILLVGYVNDLVRPESSREKYKEGYVPLYLSFESFYIQHVIRKLRKNWFIPVSSVPGKFITLLERITTDHGRTFCLTGQSTECINLGSYNYLGFAQNHGFCVDETIRTLKEHSLTTCSTRSEFGTLSIHLELEKLTATFLGTEDAITFGMGFATNTCTLPAILAGKSTLVLSDEKNHASIILGLKLSGVTVRCFKHNCMRSLEARLRQALIDGQPRTHAPWKKIIIIVEGIYSMEGSIVSMPEIIDLKKKYGVYIYLDEAHSIGSLGSRGRGVMDHFNLNPRNVDLLMGTFTKSFASTGGYIAGSKELIDVIRKRSHGNHYGTAMPPAMASQIITSMKILMNEKEGLERIKQLKLNTIYFRKELTKCKFRLYGNHDSPVVPLVAPMPTQVSFILEELVRRGVAVAGAVYPAVPLTQSRVRFCLSASHTKEMLDKVIQSMEEIGQLIYIN